MTHCGVSPPNLRTTDLLNNSIITYSQTFVQCRFDISVFFNLSAGGSVKINVLLGFGLSSPITSCSLTKVEHPAVVVTHHTLSPLRSPLIHPLPLKSLTSLPYVTPPHHYLHMFIKFLFACRLENMAAKLLSYLDLLLWRITMGDALITLYSWC